MNEPEIWGDVPIFDNYIISSYGVIQNKKTGRIMKLSFHSDGYLIIKLTKNKVRGDFLVSRLVAIVHVPNPENLPEVNHLDLIKTNNFYKNLEWCTHKRNMEHAFSNRHIRRDGSSDKHRAVMALHRKSVYAYDELSKELLVFNSHSECSDRFGVLKSTISSTIIIKNRLRGKYRLFHEESWQQFKTDNQL